MKSRFLIIVVFCLVSIQSFAHRDKVIVMNYGNVKTLLKTGFDYSETYKMTIIGKLSNQLTTKLNFADTLLIEYVNDYTKAYDRDIYQFENNNISYKFSGLGNSSQMHKNIKGVALRIYAKSIDVENILKLVEFSIINRHTLKSKLVSQNVVFKYAGPSDGIPFDLIPDNLFKKITTGKSELIEEILRNRIEIYLQKQFGIEIFWENNKFIFEYKNLNDSKDILYEIKDFYYLKEVDMNTMLVFVDEQNFYYLEGGELTDEKLFQLDFKSYRPVDVTNKFAGKIIISSNGNNGFNIFIKHDRKLITKIE